ncbi:hypothetical protein L6452_24424 [Arctium lappa]|uniref:Uncharacterized protein n=1 Tax=Arctium lappa TaxID=4217 RepID=A0ACB9ADR2_ARCLA|nr:hypothetical protein L6452_24424 [Arctium lappa]
MYFKEGQVGGSSCYATAITCYLFTGLCLLLTYDTTPFLAVSFLSPLSLSLLHSAITKTFPNHISSISRERNNTDKIDHTHLFPQSQNRIQS